MPIYAYRCEACGFAKDVLQKISDPQLTVCLSCGQPTFKKQVTAAGFQLKGTGWYATDFRGGTPPATGTAPQTDSASKATESAATSSSTESGSKNGGQSSAASSNPTPTSSSE